MRRCIYLDKTEPEVEFLSGEHIFPAGIGGIQKLPMEFVSHNCNNAFSNMERGFMRHSLLALQRQFYGPGSRGSLSEKKATQSNACILSNTENPKEIELGYISLGKPFSMMQIKYMGNGKIHFLSGTDLGEASQQLESFINVLQNFEKVNGFIEDERLDNNQFILGFNENKWYLALKSKEAQPNFQEIITSFLKQNPLNTQEATYREMQPTAHQTLSFDVDEFYRICAKIVFNYLAYQKGQNYVLDNRFAPLRNWIVNGGKNTFARLTEEESPFPSAIIFPELSHKLLIVSTSSGLVGYISFYGSSYQTVIKLCDEIKDIDSSLEGFICDWKNRKEFKWFDFLKTRSSL